MRHVQLTALARDDLVDIYVFGAERYGDEAAERYIARLHEAFAFVAEHPLAGALTEIVKPPMRSWPTGSHRVFYDVEDAAVVIRRVLHRAADMARHL